MGDEGSFRAPSTIARCKTLANCVPAADRTLVNVRPEVVLHFSIIVEIEVF